MTELTHSKLVGEFTGALEQSAGDVTQFLSRWAEIQDKYRGHSCAGCESSFTEMLKRMDAGVTLMLVHGWSPAIMQAKLSSPFGVTTTLTGLTVVNGNPEEVPLAELQTMMIALRAEDEFDNFPGSEYVN